MKRLAGTLFAAAAALLATGCSDEVAGTASGTENTVTLALADGADAMPLARVRFRAAGSLPAEIGDTAQTVVEATRSGDAFSASLAPGRLWTAELIGQDSSWRRFLERFPSPSADLSLRVGPLRRASVLRGRLTGSLGDAARIGIAGTGAWARVSSDGSYELANVVGADLPLVVARKSAGSWKLTRLDDWSSETGEVELPETLALPAPSDTAVSAWGCADGETELSWSESAEAGPASRLFRTLVPDGDGTDLVRIDLCRMTLRSLGTIASREELVLFSGGSADRVYAPGSDELWTLEDGQLRSTAGSDANQIGILSASAGDDAFVSYLYRPEGNVLSIYPDAASFVADVPSRSLALDRTDSAFVLLGSAEATVVARDGGVERLSLEDGSLLASWTSENARAVRGAALASSGVLALLAGPADSPELVMSEPVTGETLLRIPGLPAGAYALAH